MFFNILNQLLLFIFGLILLANTINNIEDPYLNHKWGIILSIVGALSCAACIIYNLFQGVIAMSVFGVISFAVCMTMIFTYMYESYHVVKYYREQGRWFVWAVLNILSILVIVEATEIMTEVVHLC